MAKRTARARNIKRLPPSVQLGTIIILLGLLTVGMVGGLAYLIRQAPSDTTVPKPDLRMVPNTWQSYTNPFGIALQYPPSWTSHVTSDYSAEFFPLNKETQYNSVYLSIISDSVPGKTTAIAHYDPKSFHLLEALGVGESAIAGPDAEYFTFRRVDNVSLGGHIARVYRRDKVWEAPVGTVEYQYYVEKGSVTYLIGGFLQIAEGDAEHIAPSLFRTILSTVSFAP